MNVTKIDGGENPGRHAAGWGKYRLPASYEREARRATSGNQDGPESTQPLYRGDRLGVLADPGDNFCQS